MRLQAAISARERMHPSHNPVSGSMRQTRVQGLSAPAVLDFAIPDP